MSFGCNAASARVTVAMVALPLSLAAASGPAPSTGQVTAMVAGFPISLPGGSRVQIGGPTRAFVFPGLGIILEPGHDGPVLARLMAGVILPVAGALRAG